MAGTMRRRPYVLLTLLSLVLVPLGWGLFAARAQDDADSARQDEAQDGTRADAVRRELAIQERRHRQRLEELESLKERLAEIDSEEARAEVQRLEEMIAEEQRDFAARRRALRAMARNAGDDEEAREWNDLARAVGRLNQSYVVAPVISPTAASGGSYYIDREDAIDRDDDLDERDPRFEEDAEARNDDEDENGEARRRRDRGVVRLPPPLYVGPHAPEGIPLPRWLYGEWPGDDRLEEWEPGAGELLRMQRSIDELTREVEELRRQLNAERGTAPPASGSGAVAPDEG